MKTGIRKKQNAVQLLDAERRKAAARRRKFTRGFRALAAILLALFAGLYLLSCNVFQRSQHGNKSRVDKKEHRKGMPVRDNIVE